MRRIITFTAFMIFMVNFAFAAELKVGHFDLQRLIAQSNAGKEARGKYLTKAKSYQLEINSRTEKLKKMKEEIEAEAKRLKDKEKPSPMLLEKEKEFAAQSRELQRLLGGYQDELKVYDSELTRKVLEELSPVLADFAKINKYDYIFKLGEPLAFASEKHDLTDDLVREFNKARKK